MVHPLLVCARDLKAQVPLHYGVAIYVYSCGRPQYMLPAVGILCQRGPDKLYCCGSCATGHCIAAVAVPPGTVLLRYSVPPGCKEPGLLRFIVTMPAELCRSVKETARK